MDTQIFGEIRAPHGIGDGPEGGGGDHHRHDGQTVKPVGEVDRIGGPHDHQHREGHEEKAQIDRQLLDEGQRKTVRERIRMDPGGPGPRDGRHEKADSQPHPPRQPIRCLLRDLGIIVRKAQQRETDRHEQDHPDMGVVPSRPEQRRDHQRRDDEQPPHRRRPRLGEMGLRPVRADRLPLALLDPQPADQRRPEGEAEDKRGQERPPCAEGDVAEQVEETPVVRQQGEPVEHRVRFLPRTRPVARSGGSRQRSARRGFPWIP